MRLKPHVPRDRPGGRQRRNPEAPPPVPDMEGRDRVMEDIVSPSPSPSRPRPLCYVPRGGCLVETCTRTIHGRPLLRPGLEANERILGVLGRAAEYYQAPGDPAMSQELPAQPSWGLARDPPSVTSRPWQPCRRFGVAELS